MKIVGFRFGFCTGRFLYLSTEQYGVFIVRVLGEYGIVQKKLTEAIALFDEAIELNPDFAQANHERGRAKLLNGDKEGSMEDMKRGLELNPKELQDFNGQYGNLPGNNTTNVLGL